MNISCVSHIPTVATPARLTTANVSAAALKAATGDGDGRTGAAALNDGDAAAQSARRAEPSTSRPDAVRGASLALPQRGRDTSLQCHPAAQPVSRRKGWRMSPASRTRRSETDRSASGETASRAGVAQPPIRSRPRRPARTTAPRARTAADRTTPPATTRSGPVSAVGSRLASTSRSRCGRSPYARGRGVDGGSWGSILARPTPCGPSASGQGPAREGRNRTPASSTASDGPTSGPSRASGILGADDDSAACRPKRYDVLTGIELAPVTRRLFLAWEFASSVARFKLSAADLSS